MASIFLSYTRGDAAKAGRIAKALEAAGHSVWWDRQLHAGSRFTAEIDEALRKADAVVVLWSRQSVESAWVQDEAAFGRDNGRLFPVLLESASPPLGFRQYQAVDLTDWSGRGKPSGLIELIKALDAKEPRQQIAAAPAPPHADRVHRNISWPLAAGIAMVLLIAAGSAWWLLGKSGPPTLLIAAADTGEAGQSRDFARQVALDLTRFHPASLETLNILDSAQSTHGADYRVEIGLNRNGKSAHADLSLIVDGRPGVSWAQGMDGPADRPADLRRQAASVVTSVIGCALEADRSQSKLNTSNFRKFLEGCSAFQAGYSNAGNDLVPTFKQTTQSAPDFAPGFALLALSEFNQLSPGDTEADRVLVDDGKVALKRAEQLDSSLEEVTAAEALFHPWDKDQWSHAFPILDRGLQLHPNSVLLLGLKSQMLMSVGRMSDATDAAREARGFDPLSAEATVRLIDALAYSNRIQGAYDELGRDEAVWPDATDLADARYRLDLRYGDPRQALGKLQTMSGSRAAFDQSWEKFLLARINPSPAAVDAALQSFRDRYRRDPANISGYLQALGTFGRVDEAFQVTANPVSLDSLEAGTAILFRPHMHSLMADPRFIDLAAKLGLLAYWRQSGVWPDFCGDPELPYDCKKEATKYPS